MLQKLLIFVLLAGIVGSLFSGLLFLYRDPNGSHRMAKALTLRIGLSLTLFILLLAGFALGWFTPNGG